jgi:hypothetical protein
VIGERIGIGSELAGGRPGAVPKALMIGLEDRRHESEMTVTEDDEPRTSGGPRLLPAARSDGARRRFVSGDNQRTTVRFISYVAGERAEAGQPQVKEPPTLERIQRHSTTRRDVA